MTETLLYSSIFLAGIGSFISPCVAPLLPVYVAFFANGTAKDGQRPLIIWLSTMLRALLFVLGISTTFFTLGFGLGALGTLINQRTLTIVMGIIVILLGLHQTELIKFKRLEQEKRIDFKQNRKAGLLSAYLLGLSFSFGWSPCVGPVLGAIIGVAAAQGNASQGALMILTYTAGFMIPFLLLAAMSTFLLRYIRKIHPYLPLIKRIGGIIIILMGILMLTGQLNRITMWFS